MFSPLAARPVQQPAFRSAPPAPATRRPQFGSVIETTAIAGSMTAAVGCYASAFAIVIRQHYWDKAVKQVKEAYAAQKSEDRLDFLAELPKRKDYKRNHTLSWWHKTTTAGEIARRVQEARKELELQDTRMQRYSVIPPKEMREMLKYFQDLKNDTREHPENYTNAAIVNSWACYMDALHMVTKAKDKRALKFEEGQKWFRMINQRWEKTPILKTPQLATTFQSMADSLGEIIEAHGRNLTDEERFEEFKETIRELVGEGLFSKADIDLVVKMADEGLMPQEDADAIAIRSGRGLSQDEADDILDLVDIVTNWPEGEKPDEQAIREGLRNAGTAIRFRRELDTATADDFAKPKDSK